MKKLIITISLLNFCFEYPLFSSVCLLGFCIYQTLSPDELSYLHSFIMSIYTNAKQFTQYLSNKAKELNLKLPGLRQHIIENLENLETINQGETQEVSIEEFDLQEPETQEESIFEQELKELLTPEELQLLKSSEALREKLLRDVREAAYVPQSVWRESTLAQMYDDPDPLVNQEETFKRWGIQVDFNKIFTEKDFKRIKSKLKALGKNEKGEIVNEQLQRTAMMELNNIYCHFTFQKYDIFNPLIN